MVLDNFGAITKVYNDHDHQCAMIAVNCLKGGICLRDMNYLCCKCLHDILPIYKVDLQKNFNLIKFTSSSAKSNYFRAQHFPHEENVKTSGGRKQNLNLESNNPLCVDPEKEHAHIFLMRVHFQVQQE